METVVIEHTPFTVPRRKSFVATGLGFREARNRPRYAVTFDGDTVIDQEARGFPPGIVAPGGTTISLTAEAGAFLMGYLVDAAA